MPGMLYRWSTLAPISLPPLSSAKNSPSTRSVMIVAKNLKTLNGILTNNRAIENRREKLLFSRDITIKAKTLSPSCNLVVG